jgi:hypothetical protein
LQWLNNDQKDDPPDGGRHEDAPADAGLAMKNYCWYQNDIYVCV